MNQTLKHKPMISHGNITIRRGGKPVYYVAALLLIFILFAPGVHAAPTKQAEPLHLGLLPHLSNHLLLKKYQKLIAYLEHSLQRKVLVHSAPNFKTYAKRCKEGRYDLYLTAPHLGVYHEVHDQHHRVARFSRELRGIISVTEDSPYRTLADLKSKTITAPDHLAVITLLGEVTLASSGIDIKNDMTIKYTSSHNNALHSTAEGRSDASIVGMPAYKITKASSKLKKPLRILSKTIAIPHMMFMCPSRLSATECDEFKLAFQAFPTTDAGKAFFSSTPFGGISMITDEDMQRLKHMLLLLEQRLKF